MTYNKVEEIEPLTKVPPIYNIQEASTFREFKAVHSNEHVSKKMKYYTDHEASQNLTGHKATTGCGGKELCASKQCGVGFDGIDGKNFNHGYCTDHVMFNVDHVILIVM